MDGLSRHLLLPQYELVCRAVVQLRCRDQSHVCAPHRERGYHQLRGDRTFWRNVVTAFVAPDWLPPEHAIALTTAAATDNMAVVAQYIALIGRVEDEIVRCFKDGVGVPYARYAAFHEAIAEIRCQAVLPSELHARERETHTQDLPLHNILFTSHGGVARAKRRRAKRDVGRTRDPRLSTGGGIPLDRDLRAAARHDEQLVQRWEMSP